MQTIRMMPCIARFLTAAALMNLFSHLVVSENSIVVRQNLGTFDSFEISDLEKLTNSAKDGVTPGTLSGMEFLRITARASGRETRGVAIMRDKILRKTLFSIPRLAEGSVARNREQDCETARR